MLRASGTKGYTRSSTRGYAGVPSCCIHSWTEGRRGGQRCAPSYGPRAENIKPRNGCARFPASGRFGPPACSHGCKPRTDFVANGNSGLTVGWALRPATVRNIATYADHGNVRKNRNRRGLNQNHNHEMKEICQGAATRASCGVGPFRDSGGL
jgi:hypothetical protein